MYSGHALKKLARELGLAVRDGVACGIYKGYAVSMWEGLSGPKTFSISAKFDDELCQKLDVDFGELEYKYQRLIYIRFMNGTLTAKFFDNQGTMSQFRNCFFDVLSILDQYDIPDADICPKCGLPMYGQGVWSMYTLFGTQTCLYAHEHCASALERETNRQIETGRQNPMSKKEFVEAMEEIQEDVSREELEEMYAELEDETKDRKKPEKRYLPGWIGAFGGCILSAILFVVLCFLDSGSHYSRGGGLGLVACCGGFIIKKGYDITRDTYGKKRCLTIIIMTVLYVFLGVLGVVIVQDAMEMNQFNTVPEGISIIEECRLYIHSGIQSVLLDKGHFLLGLLIYTPISLLMILDVILDLYNGGVRDDRMRRKRLQKRK